MRRKSLSDARCPVARTLDVVGEWWSILILRDAFRGIGRFDDLQASLGIARNMLSRRLKALVAAGMLEAVPYSTRPLRHDYRLTDKGRDFYPVIMTLMSWGNRWARRDVTREPVSRRTAQPVEPILVDRLTGEPITPATVMTRLTGPDAEPPAESMP